MRQIRFHFLPVLLAVILPGCGVISVMDAAVLVMSVPGPNQKGKLELQGYSLGPDSSVETLKLLLDVIPANEGTVHFTGRVEWTGLANVKQSFGTLYQSMAAITDSHILFVWWNETTERYEVLVRIPYTDIFSVDLWTPGFGTNIRFCHENDEIHVGEQAVGIDRRTRLRVLKPGFLIDAQQTKEVFAILDMKIKKKNETEDAPSPCDKAPDPAWENDGIGETDLG